MKRISLISLLALFLVLISIALIAFAGGPVVGKLGVDDPAPGIGSTYVAAANMHPSASASVETIAYSMDGWWLGGYDPTVVSLGPLGRSTIF